MVMMMSSTVKSSPLASSDNQKEQRQNKEQNASEEEQMQDSAIVHGGLEAHKLQHHALVKRLLMSLLFLEVVGDKSGSTVIGSNADKRERVAESGAFLGHNRARFVVVIIVVVIVVIVDASHRHHVDSLLHRLSHTVEHRSETIEHREDEHSVLLLTGVDVWVASGEDALVVLVHVEAH